MARKIPQSNWFWYLSGIIFALIGTQFQKGPGYMDSAYYTVGGLQLFEGNGFVEPYIWNYLANPKGLPAPAFVYWMPLPSLLAFMGMWLGRSPDFVWAKLPFLLMAGFLPVLTVYLTRKVITNPAYAWIAGGLAVFPGVYALYLTIPETFIPYMIGGGLFVIIAFFANNQWIGGLESFQRFLLLGFIAGWMHLTRADGLIWLISAFGVVIWRIRPWQSRQKMRVAINGLLALLLGYLILTGGWYYRNWVVFGSMFPPGNGKSLWLTSYNQLFAYPNDHLNFTNWLKAGLPAIIHARLDALSLNLQNFLVVQGSIILLPLILVGCWSKRHHSAVKFETMMWLLILGMMTIVFPFAGSRGGFLHSGAAIQIFFWSMSVAGLEQLIIWMKKARGWGISTSMTLFGTFLILINLFIAGWFFYQRVYRVPNHHVWNESIERYQRVGERLEELHISKQLIAMVNNPPGFYWATRRPSIVIPDGDIRHALAAAKRYGATYLLLEENQENLSNLYANPHDMSGVRLLETYEGVRFFLLLPEAEWGWGEISWFKK